MTAYRPAADSRQHIYCNQRPCTLRPCKEQQALSPIIRRLLSIHCMQAPHEESAPVSIALMLQTLKTADVYAQATLYTTPWVPEHDIITIQIYGPFPERRLTEHHT
jgi:hypothetical protein